MAKSNEFTTLGVKPETKERLKELRPFDGMSQDETLRLMLDVYEKQRKLRFLPYRQAVEATQMSLNKSNENGGSN